MYEQSCFIMMPFNDRFQSYYDKIFSPVVTDVGLNPVKVDEIYTPTQISVDIFQLIQSASIILADVTGKNPNVNYELGIAHALGKKTIIITQGDDDVPFDYRHLRYIVYDTRYAGWEDKLAERIKVSIQATLLMNSPTTFIAGDNLKHLFSFLENTALDVSYEISKTTIIESDLQGNCQVEQKWTVKARSDITHIIHGVVGDEPGSIKLLRSYDKTNGVDLNTLTSIGDEKRVRYIIFLSKMLQQGETLQFDLSYSAEKYLDHLFSKGSITMFQRPNSRRGVYYNYRRDVYIFPESNLTKTLSVKPNGSGAREDVTVEEKEGIVSVSVELDWPEPYSGIYSYEIVKAR